MHIYICTHTIWWNYNISGVEIIGLCSHVFKKGTRTFRGLGAPENVKHMINGTFDALLSYKNALTIFRVHGNKKG